MALITRLLLSAVLTAPMTPFYGKEYNSTRLPFEHSYNMDHYQCSLSLVFKSRPWTLYNLKKPKQYNIEEDHKMKSKLTQKRNSENILHVNITKPTILCTLQALLSLFQYDFIVLHAHLYPTLRINQWFQRLTSSMWINDEHYVACYPCGLTGTAIVMWSSIWYQNINTLRPRQDGRNFPDDIIKCIFFNQNAWISIIEVCS